MAEERLGAKFTIDTTALKAGLTQANRLIKESKSAFELAATKAALYGNSQDVLQAKIKHLNEVQELQQKKVDGLRKAYQENIEKGIDPMSASMVKMRTDLNKEETALENTKAEIQKQTKALQELGDESEDTSKSMLAVETATGKMNDGFTVAKGVIANLVADGFRAAIQAAKDFTKELIEVGKTFDSSMSQVAAVSGATGNELNELEEKAKAMGASTKFTASEAADAFNYMAMAGWKTEEMLGGIDGILNLAAASGADLATTSDIVTDALTAMGYKAADAGRLADVMAAASSNANTNVEMMGATFQYAAPLVGALGYSMEDTAVAIGLMANAGIKGEKAGTALRSVFTRLASPPKACAEAMGDLGISLTDTSGKMKPFADVMQDLRQKFSKLNETEQASYASHIAGQEAMSGLLAIVNAAPADFEKLTQAVANSDGAAQKMADTMLDNLGGDLTIMQSALEGVKLEIYDGLEPSLRSATQTFTNKFVPAISKSVVPSIKSFFKQLDKDKTVEKFSNQALNLAKKVLPTVAKAGKFCAENIDTIASVTLTAVTAFTALNAAMKVATAITAAKTATQGLTAGVGLATKAQTIWNAAMSANPIGAVITAVALLTTGIALLVASQDNASKSTDLLSESQRQTVTAAQEAADAYRETKSAADELAGSQLANVDYVTNNLLPALKNLVDSNGKVKEGDEARAQFILGELNKALGTEYKQLSDIVDANGNIKDSIYQVIEAKKAQILLSAYEEQYKTAVENVAAAEKARATQAQELAKQDEKTKQAQAVMEKAYADYLLNVNDTYLNDRYAKAYHAYEEEKKQLDAKKAAYDQSQSDLYTYYKDISDYETASTLVMQGETEKAIGYLNNLSGGFETVESTAKLSAEEQKKVLEQQVIDTEVNAQLMKDAYESGVEGVSEEMVKTAREQAEKAKSEFYKVGGDITKGIAEGANGEEKTNWTLSGAMKNLISTAVAAAKKAAGIKSPSRLFKKEVGVFIGKGIAVGIDDSTKDVIKAVNRQVKSIQRAYDVGAVTATVASGATSNATAEQQNASGIEGKSVTVNQTNYYSQAHSRYELYKSKQQTAAAVRLALVGG